MPRESNALLPVLADNGQCLLTDRGRHGRRSLRSVGRAFAIDCNSGPVGDSLRWIERGSRGAVVVTDFVFTSTAFFTAAARSTLGDRTSKECCSTSGCRAADRRRVRGFCYAPRPLDMRMDPSCGRQRPVAKHAQFEEWCK